MDKRIVKLLEANILHVRNDAADLKDSIKEYMPLMNRSTNEKDLYDHFDSISEHIEEAIYYLDKAKGIFEEALEEMA